MSDENYNREAKALALQERARHENNNTPDIEPALRKPDLSKMVPEGVDAQAYIASMVSKAEASGWYDDAPAASPDLPHPRVPTFKRFGRSIVAADARPGDLLEVDLGGGRLATVEAEFAVSQGMVARRSTGGYEAIPDAQRDVERQEVEEKRQQDQARESAEMEEKRATGEEPDVDAEKVFRAINSIVPPEAVQVMVKDFADNGTLSEANIVRVAKAVGISEEAAFTFAQHGVEGVRRQSDTAIATKGVPSEEADAMYLWAAQHYPLDHKNAVLSLAFASDAQPMKALAVKYRAWKQQG